ncbi:MAG TPA: DNA-processing protein DprA [Candidatus Dojkabacteria bacterium]|nr:DNA-processing protein DprA [Candidatus Dojkabacteria bacterium]
MKIVKKNDKRFPFLLKQISDPPDSIFCSGDISFLKNRCITIVGTREITEYGRRVINLLLGNFLKELDIVVVSGMARGVDEYVHKVCLRRGIKTMAILPGGLKDTIPERNSQLKKEIEKNGLLVAEYPNRTHWGKYLYIKRNRILAGVSQEVVVIQAGEKSGSLSTARLALDYNRDVFVVPGDITRNVSKGCNMLAREGAGIITSLDDFKNILGIEGDQLTFDKERKGK